MPVQFSFYRFTVNDKILHWRHWPFRDARFKRRLSVVEVARQVGVSEASIYFLGERSLSATGCQPEHTVQVLTLPIRASA